MPHQPRCPGSFRKNERLVMTGSVFQGCIPALMTPCNDDRTPNFDALTRKGKELIDLGMSAVVYCGSMGDWPLLTDEQRQEGVKRLDMFFSHCHWDHIFGIPFFMPFYRGSMKIRIWSGHLAGVMTTHDMIAGIMKAPYFPIAPEIFIADVDYQDFKPGDVLKPHDGITLRTGSLNHPNAAVGYRVEFKGKCACYITDTEHVPGRLDQNVLKLIDHADLVIYDAAFVEKEMQRYRGFGHSSWEEGVRLCRAAHAKRLAIFHHSPLRTDDELDQIGKDASGDFSGAFVARQGQVIEL